MFECNLSVYDNKNPVYEAITKSIKNWISACVRSVFSPILFYVV